MAKSVLIRADHADGTMSSKARRALPVSGVYCKLTFEWQYLRIGNVAYSISAILIEKDDLTIRLQYIYIVALTSLSTDQLRYSFFTFFPFSQQITVYSFQYIGLG